MKQINITLSVDALEAAALAAAAREMIQVGEKADPKSKLLAAVKTAEKKFTAAFKNVCHGDEECQESIAEALTILVADAKEFVAGRDNEAHSVPGATTGGGRHSS